MVETTASVVNSALLYFLKQPFQSLRGMNTHSENSVGNPHDQMVRYTEFVYNLALYKVGLFRIF